MTDKTLVERLRMTGKRISVRCPDGIDGCLVNHFRIETDPLCDEAATRIEALEAALRKIEGQAVCVAMPATEDEMRDWLQNILQTTQQALESQP